MEYVILETIDNTTRQVCKTTDRIVVEKIISSWVEDTVENDRVSPDGNGFLGGK